MKKLSLLGSTGSIGTQALDVVRGLSRGGFPVQVEVLAARSNIRLLEEQIREFRPAAAVVYDPVAAQELRVRIRDLQVPVLEGIEGLCEAAAWDTADMTLNAVVGMVGLRPTLAAIRAKKTVALANKETLVAGGRIVMGEAEQNKVSMTLLNCAASDCATAFARLLWPPPRVTDSGSPRNGRLRSTERSPPPASRLSTSNTAR